MLAKKLKLNSSAKKNYNSKKNNSLLTCNELPFFVNQLSIIFLLHEYFFDCFQ
jgi:hypothetical protein